MSGWHPHKRKPRNQHSFSKTPGTSFAATCLRIVDAGFCGTIFIAPLFFGGRHDLGRFVFVVLACITALAWCGRQIALGGGKWTRSTMANAIVAAAVAMVVLQLIPLPDRWLEFLTPRTGRLLPLWSAETSGGPQLSSWQTISLTPSATRIALAMLLGYSLLFVTAVQRLREASDIERMLNWIALASIFMGIFALVQYSFSNGLYFWFYQHPFKSASDNVSGSFTNRNHFAQFLVLGIGPLLAWIVRRHQGNNSVGSRSNHHTHRIAPAATWLYCGLAVAIISVLLSFSRGGALALGAALTTSLVLFYRAGQTTFRALLTASAMTLLVIGILSIYGYEKVSDRLDDLTTVSLEEIDARSGRRKIWAANLAAIQSGGLLGSGAGSHRYIYPVYLQEPYQLEYTHAENGPLQITTENGWLGGFLLVCALSYCGILCCGSLRSSASSRNTISTIAVTASLVASVVHALVDFIWFIPACMSLTLLLVACLINLMRLSRFSNSDGAIRNSRPAFLSLTRLRWVELGFVELVVIGWMATVLAGPAFASLHYDRYLLDSRACTQLELSIIASQKEETPSDIQSREMYFHSIVGQLQKVVQLHPDSAKAHLRLANQHLKQFERVQIDSDNSMTVEQIRDAAMASGFKSSKELQQWLARAFGPNVEHLYRAYLHTRLALKFNPLQGSAYLNLANLCFLEGKKPADIEAYLEQSLRLRPQDCDVLFEVGRQYLLIGQYDKVSSYWTKAFRNRGKHQLRIVQWMAGRIPAVEFIETFQPNWDTLGVLWKRYLKLGQEEDLRVLAEYAKQVAVDDNKQHPTPIQVWLTLARMQSHLNENKNALVSLTRAYQIAPSSYAVRRALSRGLIAMDQFQAAEPHLRWCLARRPNDNSVRSDLVLANKEIISKNHQAMLPQQKYE